MVECTIIPIQGGYGRTVRRFLIWVIRSFFVAVFLPGLVNAFSGHYLFVLMKFLSWPIIRYVRLMPSDSTNSFDGVKWFYTACTLFVEVTFVIGIILMIAELIGKPRLSNPSMRFIAHLTAQIEVSIHKAWNLAPHECDFYWLVAKGNDYDYFTSDRHLTDEDKKVIRRAFLQNQDIKPETNLRNDFPRHPAHEYVFIRNSGDFQAGVMVFINKQGVLNRATVDSFVEVVEPIISLDGTKEIMVELTKRRGVIVV